MKKIKNQSGQVIIILLLIMLVALSIGLVATQRSVTDVTTSTQSDQSTRAFSAAEAGIEQIIQRGGTNSLNVTLGDNARFSVNASDLPKENEGLEYPPIGKEVIAQVWFADPNSAGSPTKHYGGSSVDIYFGNKGLFQQQGLADAYDLPAESKPAISLTFINRVGTGASAKYESYKVYLDSVNRSNNFWNPSTSGANQIDCQRNGLSAITTTSSTSSFYCKKTINIKRDDSDGAPLCNTSDCYPVLVRIRMLYATEPQKIAIVPTSSTCTNASHPQPCLPKQANRYVSTGQAGRSQKTIEVFRVKKVVPPWFDFAIFSAGAIEKN